MGNPADEQGSGLQFDRLLIAQAQLEGVCLLSSDRALRAYGRSVLLLQWGGV